ncbi:MAG: 50S ribosomal protein L3 [Burkholderiales bacterium]
MGLGLIGRKIGMTRVFAEDGSSVPVTVLDMSGNRVAQLKSAERDGYCALQIACGSRRPNRVNKAAAGHFAKAGIEAGNALREFRVDAAELARYKPGDAIKLEVFQAGQRVDVTATSQGKGFAGGIKRHHFRSNRGSHGNSVSHRKPGSTGQCQSPGRVFPGKRMPGHMGAVKRTAQNLKVERIDVERQLLLVRGAVPGAKGAGVAVRPSVKAKM